MPDTFLQAWQRAAVLLPTVPSLLVRDWIHEGYLQLCQLEEWSHLRGESQLVIKAARSLAAVGVTEGSSTVTSAGLFLAADQGRQFRVSGRRVFTISTFTDVNTLTLDRVWEDETNAATAATILDAYATMPSDFARFLVIQDPYQQRPGGIPFWFTEDEIEQADPNRLISDSYIRAVVSSKYSSAGRIRYEYWPYPTSIRSYPFLYMQEASRPADSDELPGVLANRGDLLRLYAQWQAAMWPGTRDERNVMYSLPNAQTLQKRWEEEVQSLWLSDDNIYPMQYMRPDRYSRGVLTGPTSLLRQTDADLSDYL